MALLFLKRSDLLPDLRESLQKRVTILDPVPFPKGGSPAKSSSPGKSGSPGKGGPDLKGLAKKNPTGSPESPGSKEAEEATLTADLGEVKAGQTTELPLKVRGPMPFRITGVRGGDAQLQAQADSQSAKVHELALTLRPEREGPLERTLYLRTDLPGRAEVAVRLRARVTAAPPP